MSKIYKINNHLMEYKSNCIAIVDPLNPLNLPPNTVRVRTNDGNVPNNGYYDTATLVSGTSDVYDVYYGGTDLRFMLAGGSNIVEVLGANTTGVTNMAGLFSDCISLTNVPLFDTSKVTSMNGMFLECRSLTTVPLFNTSKVTDMYAAFYNCTMVQSGALALYQQASSQATPPSDHRRTFYQCGSNTQTGSAELAQIPSDWK